MEWMGFVAKNDFPTRDYWGEVFSAIIFYNVFTKSFDC